MPSRTTHPSVLYAVLCQSYKQPDEEAIIPSVDGSYKHKHARTTEEVEDAVKNDAASRY